MLNLISTVSSKAGFTFVNSIVAPFSSREIGTTKLLFITAGLVIKSVP